jgi:magnesium chelatase family protein
MSLTQLSTRAQEGINAPEVNVEVHISNGLPTFTVVGINNPTNGHFSPH